MRRATAARKTSTAPCTSRSQGEWRGRACAGSSSHRTPEDNEVAIGTIPSSSTSVTAQRLVSIAPWRSPVGLLMRRHHKRRPRYITSYGIQNYFSRRPAFGSFAAMFGVFFCFLEGLSALRLPRRETNGRCLLPPSSPEPLLRQNPSWPSGILSFSQERLGLDWLGFFDATTTASDRSGRLGRCHQAIRILVRTCSELMIVTFSVEISQWSPCRTYEMSNPVTE